MFHNLTIGDVLAAKQNASGLYGAIRDRRAYAAGYSDRQNALAPNCEGVKSDAYFRGYCERLCEEIDCANRADAAVDAAHADLSALDDDNGRHNWWGLADESHSAR